MNIAESFAGYLETLGIATLGQDLFIGNAPSTDQVSDNIWWIKSSGGNKDTALATGESVKLYFIEIYCRNASYGAIYNSLHALEETLNCDGCSQLQGFETIDVSAAVLTIDDDLDSEDRKVGLLQANLTTYKTCPIIS